MVGRGKDTKKTTISFNASSLLRQCDPIPQISVIPGVVLDNRFVVVAAEDVGEQRENG
jgi:hypothetical protein